jgi:hypothetical protein
MLINHIYSVEGISDEGASGIGSAALLTEVKDYLRVEGFNPSDAPSEFDFDDTLISDLIEEALDWVERITNVTIRPKLLKVVLLNQAGMLALPGPVRGAITYFEDSGCQALDTIGTEFPKLCKSCCSQQTIEYAAGYEVLPGWVKNALKAYVAWSYENRGDEEKKGQPERAYSIVRPFRRARLWG